MSQSSPGQSFNDSSRTPLTYKNADPMRKGLMENAMVPIDREPDSWRTVEAYGNKPVQEQQQAERLMIQLERQFAEYGSKIAYAVDALVNYTQSIGAERLRQPGTLENVAALVAELSVIDIGLQQVGDVAKSLGQQQQATVDVLDIHVAAAPEVLRRYGVEYIPDARQSYKNGRMPEDFLFLQDVQLRRVDFGAKAETLQTTFKSAVALQEKIGQLAENVAAQSEQLRDIIISSRDGWNTLVDKAAGKKPKAGGLTLRP